MTTIPFIESQDFLDQPEALKERLYKNGYLFIRGMLDPEPLLNLRRDYLEICQKHGWLLANTRAEEGRGRADAYEGYFEFTDVYKDIQLLESFHAMPHHPKILDTLKAVFGCDVLPHARNISRITLPGSHKMTTPSHQDYVFIQGSQDVFTVWFPLTDCPFELGGLAMATGTHNHGIYPTKQAEGTGGLCTDVDDDSLEWHASEFKLGDIIMFHSLTIHKAFSNMTKDLLRFSCDFRYQPLRDRTLVWNSLRPHMQLHSWEDIYANWQKDTHKYYWHKQALHVIPDIHPGEVKATVR